MLHCGPEGIISSDIKTQYTQQTHGGKPKWTLSKFMIFMLQYMVIWFTLGHHFVYPHRNEVKFFTVRLAISFISK